MADYGGNPSNPEYQSVTTEDLHTASREADAVVLKKGDGTTVALGDSGRIDSGDDAWTVINSALTAVGESGVVEVTGPSTYVLSDAIRPRHRNQLLRCFGAKFEPESGFETARDLDTLYRSKQDDCIVMGGEWDGKYPDRKKVGGLWVEAADRNMFFFVEAHHTDGDGGALDFGITGPESCVAAFNDTHHIHGREGGIHCTSHGARVIGNTIWNSIPDDGASTNTKTEAGLKAGAEGSVQAFNTVMDFEDTRGIYYTQQVWDEDHTAHVLGIGNNVYNAKNGIEITNNRSHARIVSPTVRDVQSDATGWGCGIEVKSARSCRIVAPDVQDCTEGIFIDNGDSSPSYVADNRVTITDPTVVDCIAHGITANAPTTIKDPHVFEVSDFEGIVVGGDNSKIVRPVVNDIGFDNVKIDANDVRIEDPELAGALNDQGTRTRWNGTIGGGILGGIDLSSVSGQQDGEEAVSDGTATDFPYGTRATWDAGNSQWVRVDGQATVAPA